MDKPKTREEAEKLLGKTTKLPDDEGGITRYAAKPTTESVKEPNSPWRGVNKRREEKYGYAKGGVVMRGCGAATKGKGFKGC